MRKFFIVSIALFLPLICSAQEEVETMEVIAPVQTEQPTEETQPQALPFRFGIVSKEAIIKSIPDYLKVDQEMETLKANFEAEAKRSADEFNAKYESFLNEQRNYAPSIMRKRQAELEEMMRSNENFRIESHRLLREARQEALRPLVDKVDEAIRKVAAEQGLFFVLNADADRVPYYLEDVGMDITELVKQSIK